MKLAEKRRIYKDFIKAIMLSKLEKEQKEQDSARLRALQMLFLQIPKKETQEMFDYIKMQH